MILVYDTETTGLPLWGERSHDPRQPHLVHLALVACVDDGRVAQEISVIIRPDGWVIPPDTTKIHGISQERALDEGIDETAAVKLFVWSQARCAMRVAHNLRFDDRIMRIAMLRAGLHRDFIDLIASRPSFCTMQAARPLVALASSKLSSCIEHFFGRPLDGAHNALVDAQACARLYFHLRQQYLGAPAEHERETGSAPRPANPQPGPVSLDTKPDTMTRAPAPATPIRWGD